MFIIIGKLYKTESKHENNILNEEEIDQKPIILENGTGKYNAICYLLS